MPTYTTNYNIPKPLVNDPQDEDLWGDYLNDGMDVIDAALYSIATASPASTIPSGAGMDFWGTTAPDGWLFPYGQAISRTTYAALFSAIGTTHGGGDGSTTFNLPDKRGRTSFSKDDMGGTSANRLTGQSGGINGDVLGAVGGEETHLLTTAETPAHSHLLFNGDSITTGATPTNSNYAVVSSSGYGNLDYYITGTATQPGYGLSSSVGGGNAHNILPPGIVCNYIIKT